MNILLIRSNPDIKNHSFVPPIGLGILARIADNNKHNVKIMDCANDNTEDHEYYLQIIRFRPDIIGIQIQLGEDKIVKRYLKKAKFYFKNIKVFAGGSGFTSKPQYYMKEIPEIDYGFIGEAENGFDQVLKGAINASVENLVYRDGDKIIINEQKFSDDFWKHGYPLWEQINPNDYPLSPQGGYIKQYPVAQIQVSRGCPYSCTFCSANIINGKKVRYRPVEQVMNEIQLSDYVFTMNKDYVHSFCDLLIKKKIGITWTCPNGVRLDSLDRDLVLHMKKAGCYALSFGIETGSKDILKQIKKGVSHETIKEKLKMVNECGITTIGFFIIGYPTETISDIEQTIKFSKKLPLDRANFSLFMPIPGTEAYRKFIKTEDIDEGNYGNFVLAGYKHPSINQKRMKELQKKAFRNFYLRPRILIGLIKGIKSKEHLKILLGRWFGYAK